MTPGRRTLRIDSLDLIMPEVGRLLGGHSTVGNWSLGQICRHLGAILRASVDLPASTQFDPSLRVDEATKRAILESGFRAEGVPTARRSSRRRSSTTGRRPTGSAMPSPVTRCRPARSSPTRSLAR